MDLNRLPAKLNCLITRPERPSVLNNLTAKVNNNDMFTEKGNLDTVIVQKVIDCLIVAVTESVQNNHERHQHVNFGDSQLFTHHNLIYQSESKFQVETDSANESAMVSNSCIREDVTDLVDQLIVAICELNNRKCEHSDQGYFERLAINEVNLKHLISVGNRSNTNQHVDSDVILFKNESKHSSNGEMQCLMVGCSNSGHVPSSTTIQQAKSNDLNLPKINLVNTQRATNNLDVHIPDDVRNLVDHLIAVISRLQNSRECQPRQQADSQISKNRNSNIYQLTNANCELDNNYQASFNILNQLTTTLINEAVVTHNSSDLDEIKNLLDSLTNAVNEENSDCEFQHCDPRDSINLTIPSAVLDQLPSTVDWLNINCPSTRHSFTTLINESLINVNPCVLDEINIQADYFNVAELTLSRNSDCEYTESCDYQDSRKRSNGYKQDTIPAEVCIDAQALCPVEPNVTNKKKDCYVSVMPQNSWQIDNILTYLGGCSFPTCHVDSMDSILNDSLQNTLAEVSISEDESLQELTPTLSSVEDSLEEIVKDSQSQSTVSTHTSERYEDFENMDGNISFDRHESVIKKTLISEVTIDQILPQFQCDEDDESLPEFLIEDNNFDLDDELDVCEIMEHFYYNETLASVSQFSDNIPQDATPSLVSQSSLQSNGDSEWFSRTQPFQILPDCEDVTFSPVVGFGCTQPFRPTLSEDSSDSGRSCCAQSCTSLNGIGYLEVGTKYIHRGTSPIPTEAMFGRDMEVKPVSDFNQRHPTANLYENNDDQHVPNIKEPPPSGQSHIREHSNLVPDIENMENSHDTNSDPYLYSCKVMSEELIPTLPLLPGTQRPLRIGLSRREHVQPLHKGFNHPRK